jgi:hypothetical protein
MNRAFLLALALLAAPGVETRPASAQPSVPAPLTLDVRNLARVPPAVLRETLAEVERTFLAAGVRIAWVHAAAPAADTTPLKVFLVGGAPAGVDGEDGPGAAVVGLAPPGGDWVQVFYGRLVAAIGERPIAMSVVLAHVIAHELGHLLLPPESHVPFGVMARAVDLGHPAIRRFTTGQAHLIRSAVQSGQRFASRCEH